LIEFKNIIQLDLKDANVYHQRVCILLKLGGLPDLRAAFGELSKPVEIDPSLSGPIEIGEILFTFTKDNPFLTWRPVEAT